MDELDLKEDFEIKYKEKFQKIRKPKSSPRSRAKKAHKSFHPGMHCRKRRKF